MINQEHIVLAYLIILSRYRKPLFVVKKIDVKIGQAVRLLPFSYFSDERKISLTPGIEVPSDWNNYENEKPRNSDFVEDIVCGIVSISEQIGTKEEILSRVRKNLEMYKSKFKIEIGRAHV